MSQIASVSSAPDTAASTDPANTPATPAAPANAATPAASTTSNASTPPSSQPAPTTANQRLLIQETGEMGVFVYTILDRSTGSVLAQFPQVDVADMATSETYSNGAVIDTTA